MNKYNIFLVGLLALFVLSNIFSQTIGNNEVTLNVPKTTYLMESDDTFDVEFSVTNNSVSYDNPVTNSYKVEFTFEDEDDQDNFDIQKSVFTGDICGPNQYDSYCSTNDLKAKIHIRDRISSDTYKIYLELSVNDRFVGRIPISVSVDEHNDILDVKLEKDTFCIDEAPYSTNLIFTNDSSSDYYIIPKMKSDDLEPRVRDSEVKVDNDKERRVFIEFEREPAIGQYELELDSTYRRIGSNTENDIKKKMTVTISDCTSDNQNIIIRNSNISVRTGERVPIIYEIRNTANESMQVFFRVESQDSTLNVTQDLTNATIRAKGSITNTIYVTPNPSAQGTKRITVYASTPYASLSASTNVNIIKSNVDISQKSINAVLGTKTVADITVTNNTPSTVTINLTNTSNNDDTVYFAEDTLTLAPNETKIAKLNIVPRSLGTKTVTMNVGGDSSISKDIIYKVNATMQSPSFVDNYVQRMKVEKNSTNNLQVSLYNSNNFTIDLTIGLEGDEDIQSGSAQVTGLKPQERRAVNIPFSVGNIPPKKYNMNLVVSTELGQKKLPVVIGVDTDVSNTSPLEVSNMPVSIPFAKGKAKEVTFKIKNNNSLTINDASIKIYDGQKLISTQVFTIGANETKDVKTSILLNNDSSSIGKVILSGTDSSKEYEFTLTPSDSFVDTGLFGLGLGNSIGVILGLIVLVLLFAFFSYNPKPKQSEDSNIAQRAI